MSTVNEIKNKKVDYQVVTSATDIIISAEEDHGKLSVVVDENNNKDNAIYVGDTHLASGYGFDNIETKRSVEELIANENIRKLLSSDLNINTDTVPSSDNSESGALVNSDPITIKNDDIIYIEDGVLKSTSWLNITDIVIGYKVDGGEVRSITPKDNVDISMLSTVVIDSVRFSFTISFDYISIRYGFIFDNSIYDDTLLPTFQSMNPLTIDGSHFDGKTHSMTLSNLNITVPKDINNIELFVPLNMYFCDEDKKYQTKINIGTINFKYPIFKSSGNTFDISDIDFSASEDLYTEDRGCIINVGSTGEDSKHYIVVPHLLNNPSFVLKSSDIGCTFTKISNNYNINNSDPNLNGYYDVYESPREYNTIITWIVK